MYETTRPITFTVDHIDMLREVWRSERGCRSATCGAVCCSNVGRGFWGMRQKDKIKPFDMWKRINRIKWISTVSFRRMFSSEEVLTRIYKNRTIWI